MILCSIFVFQFSLLDIPGGVRASNTSSRASSYKSAGDDIVVIDTKETFYWKDFITYSQIREKKSLVAEFNSAASALPKSRARLMDWVLELVLYFKVRFFLQIYFKNVNIYEWMLTPLITKHLVANVLI